MANIQDVTHLPPEQLHAFEGKKGDAIGKSAKRALGCVALVVGLGGGITVSKLLCVPVGVMMAIPGTGLFVWTCLPTKALREKAHQQAVVVIEDAANKGVAAADKVVEGAVDQDLPYLLGVAKQVIRNAGGIGVYAASDAVADQLGATSQSDDTGILDDVEINGPVMQDAAIFAARTGVKAGIPKLKNVAAEEIQEFLGGESEGLQGAVVLYANDTIDKATHLILTRFEKVVRCDTTGPSVVERWMNTWTVGAQVGPAASFIYTSDRESGAELVVRASAAIFSDQGVLGTFITEAAVSLIPQELHNSRASKALGRMIPEVGVYGAAASQRVDALTNLSDDTKSTLFQGATTLAYSALNEGAMMVPYGGAVFTETAGHIGAHLGLVDAKHFTGKGNFFERSAIRVGIGVATTSVAETAARPLLGDEAAWCVYMAGNLIASPKGVTYIVESRPYQTVRGAVHSATVGAVKWVVGFPNEPTDDKLPERSWLGRIWDALGSEGIEDTWV